MSQQDEINEIRRQIADLTLRLNAIRVGASVAVPHALLSAPHNDTLPAGVQAGDTIYGNATPAWARRGKGNNGDIYTLIAGYPGWQALSPGSVPGVVPNLHMRENFDLLSIGPIHGKGVYRDLSAWASTLPATSTINVAVKSGSDYMLTCTSVAGEAEYNAKCTFSNNWGFSGGGRLSFKMRASNILKGTYGLRFKSGASILAQIYFREATNLCWTNGAGYTQLIVPVNNTWYEIDLLLAMNYAWVSVDGIYRFFGSAGTPGCLWDTLQVFGIPNAAIASTADFDDIVVVNAYGLETF